MLQVRRIFGLMGSPRDGDYGFELHPEAQRFLAKEPYYPGQSLRSAIPTASDSALDLLQGK